jgi:hypothetical protein
MNGDWSLDGWSYRRKDSLLGPLSHHELRELVAYGHLRPTDTVWKSWRRPDDWLLLPAPVRLALRTPDRTSRRAS